MDHYNLQKLHLIAATCRGFNLVYIFVLSCKGYFSILSHSYKRNGYLLLSMLKESFNSPHVERKTKFAFNSGSSESSVL